MSVTRRSEFQGLDAIEKVATTKAMHRCRTLAEWIVNKLDRETEPFHDLAEFAAFQASLDDAAQVLKQKGSRRERVKLAVSKRRLSQATWKIDRFAAAVEKRAARLALLANENSSQKNRKRSGAHRAVSRVADNTAPGHSRHA
jgi:hypothetical protein